MRDFYLNLSQMPLEEGDRLVLANHQNVKKFNRFIGFFAHICNLAIQTTYQGKVWYISAESFAKSCHNPADITNEALRSFVKNKPHIPVSSAAIKKNKGTPLPTPGKLTSQLGKNFKWPSDHLPIGGTVTLEQGTPIRFVSYNVLKQNYIGHITSNNAQGLNGSDITKPSQTAREARICDQIIEMIKAGNGVLVLQECSLSLRQKIASAIKPLGYEISVPNPPNDEGPCIYNANRYSVTLSHEAPYNNKGQPVGNKYINTFELTVKKTQEKIRIVNTHVQQGNANVLGQKLLAAKTHEHVLVMGDMNAQPTVISNALGNGLKHTCVSGNRPTHINTQQELVGYDQVHLITPEGKNQLKATIHQGPEGLFRPGSKVEQDISNVFATLNAHRSR